MRDRRLNPHAGRKLHRAGDPILSTQTRPAEAGDDTRAFVDAAKKAPAKKSAAPRKRKDTDQ